MATFCSQYILLTLLTCAVTRILASVCVSSYDVILKFPLGEWIHLGDGSLALQYEERFVLHSKCGGILTAVDLPQELVLVKTFFNPRPLHLDSIVTSLGEVTWVKETTAEADVEGNKYVTRARITLSLADKKLEATSGVRLTVKWRAPRYQPWAIDSPADISRISSTNYIEMPSWVKEDQVGSIADIYDKTVMTFTAVVPRTRPILTAEIAGGLITTPDLADPAKTTVLSKFESSGNQGYGAWDVYTHECKLQLSEGTRPDLNNVIWNISLTLSKSASEPFGYVRDVPALCEEVMGKSHLLVWQYLVGYVIYTIVSRLLFGLDAVFASSTQFLIRLLRYSWKLIFAVVTLMGWLYVYADVRSPSCDALFGAGKFPWLFYFFWTVMPSVVFVAVAWPLWLNVMANEQTDEIADQLMAMNKGEQQRERGRSKLFLLFCKALAPALYISVVIFQYRVLVTEQQVLDVWVAALMTAIVFLPVWVSRGVWRPEPKNMSDRLLIVTFVLPLVMAGLWHTIY